MIRGLAEWPEFTVDLLVAKNELTHALDIPIDNGLAGMPVRRLPLTRRTAEWMWKALGLPSIDRWCPGTNWLYCPAEAYVPVRQAQLAVTVHDIHAFEENLPWSHSLSHRRFATAWRLMFAKLRRRADLFLTVSDFTKRRLVEVLNIDPQRIVIVGNGVSDIFFQKSPETPTDNYALVVGGLWPRKGGDIVLSVAKQLQRRGCDLPIWVTGFNTGRLTAAAQSLPNVRLIGSISDATLASLYRNATVLFFPSRYEGFGIPVAEAFASGAPVICSNSTALPEVAGGAAIQIDAEDVNAAVEALLRIREDRAWRSELIRKGRLRAEDLRWGNCVEKLAVALQERST
jgi:glycosyltransferase involved in cell wall biosynthesis